MQKTISNQVSCNGIGIHHGKEATITLVPAPADTGIVFRRVDIANKEQQIVKADYRNVVEASYGTTISNSFGTKVATIEHLMAAIWGYDIDNLFIDIDGPEVPIMDGSSAPFIFLIECAGITNLEKKKQVIEVLKTVRVQEGDKFVEVSPAKEFGVDIEIDFNHPKIGKQNFSYNSAKTSFKNDISRARTFGFKHEIEYLQKAGLAKGGSLQNAILIDENGVVNEEGLRYHDELVRHKTLDFVGDIYLASHYICGHFNAVKCGHAINNKLLHALFADQDAWKLI